MAVYPYPLVSFHRLRKTELSMSNKAHDHVHRLVHSMSRAEKRYFKLYTGRHMLGGHSNHQLLFDAIAAMPEYDEAALLHQFQGEAFTHRFAITKRRLYEAILRSLDAFHAESSVDARLHRMLHQVELLHQRALYEDAAKMLQSARKLAVQHERHVILVQALQWERRLLERANYAHATALELDRIAAESEALRIDQQQLDELWDVKSRLLMGLYRQGKVRDAQALEELRRLLDRPVMREPARLGSARARFLFHHLHGAASFAGGDMPTCRTHLTAAFDVLLGERERFLDEPHLVLSVLSNLIYVHVRLGAYEQAFELLHQFRTLPGLWEMPETEDLDLKLFCTSTSLELTIHCQMGAFEKALELAGSVERGLAQHEDRLGAVRKAGFYYQLAYAYFGAGQYQQALRWTNRLLNDVHIDESAEIVCFGRLLNLLAHIEGGKREMLPYALRSTERYLQTRGRAHKFEPVFLAMVHGIMKARDEQALRRTYEQFMLQLAPLETDPMEQVVFDHLDPLAWAESKLTGRSYGELVRERADRLGKAA
jgi:tetratricopeptide (TPR) repeat protein